MVKNKTGNIKEYQRQYYLSNRERILLYAKAQRQENTKTKFSSIKKDKPIQFNITKTQTIFNFN